MDSLAAERVNGLEDDDNFFELIRQQSALRTRAQAVELACDVTLEVVQHLDRDYARELLSKLPHVLEDFVYPKLGDRSVPERGQSLKRLERTLCQKWGLDLERAALCAGAVGLAISERVPALQMESVAARLPGDLGKLFRWKSRPAAA